MSVLPSALLRDRVSAAPLWRGTALFVVVSALAIAAPLVLPLNNYVLSLFMQASTYAIAVLGLTIVLGYAGQINLAQAAFFGIGAYSVALGTASFGQSAWLALLIGLGVAAAAGILLGLASLRVGGHYLAMVTISFQTMLSLVLINWVSFTRGPDGVPGIERPSLFGYPLTQGEPYLSVCIAALCVTVYLTLALRNTRLGRAMRAVRDNELAAGVLGVDTLRTKVTAFSLSALLGGLGGGLFAAGFSYVSPDQFTFSESVVFLTMVLLGGVHSPFGAALGTALLILLPEWLRFLKAIYLTVYGCAVVLIMVFMPDGIWGFAAKLVSRLFPAPPRDRGAAPAFTLTHAAARHDGALLALHGLSKHFGGVRAVDQVDLAVETNSVHALIGPNGSGKTTMLNVLSGIYRPTGGRIEFDGRDVSALAPHRRAGLGIGRTFQNIRLFAAMSVLENVMVGAERPHLSIPGGRHGLEQHALAALDFVGLAHRADDRVGDLSYGHQKVLEIARTLAGLPKLILLDEPGAGLNHAEKSELVALLKRLKAHGLTILIIDHDISLVQQVADRITVLNFGARIAEGTCAQVLRHPDVIAAYLGKVTHNAPA